MNEWIKINTLCTVITGSRYCCTSSTSTHCDCGQLTRVIPVTADSRDNEQKTSKWDIRRVWSQTQQEIDGGINGQWLEFVMPPPGHTPLYWIPLRLVPLLPRDLSITFITLAGQSSAQLRHHHHNNHQSGNREAVIVEKAQENRLYLESKWTIHYIVAVICGCCCRCCSFPSSATLNLPTIYPSSPQTTRANWNILAMAIKKTERWI